MGQQSSELLTLPCRSHINTIDYMRKVVTVHTSI